MQLSIELEKPRLRVMWFKLYHDVRSAALITTFLFCVFHTNHIEAETKWPPFSRRHVKCIFCNENIWIAIKISLKFVPKDSINNITALIQIMAWRRPGDKPISDPMMVILPTHICVTRPQWAKMITGNMTINFSFHWSNDSWETMSKSYQCCA